VYAVGSAVSRDGAGTTTNLAPTIVRRLWAKAEISGSASSCEINRVNSVVTDDALAPEAAKEGICENASGVKCTDLGNTFSFELDANSGEALAKDSLMYADIGS
jgi:hypothetical protein